MIDVNSRIVKQLDIEKNAINFVDEDLIKIYFFRRFSSLYVCYLFGCFVEHNSLAWELVLEYSTIPRSRRSPTKYFSVDNFELFNRQDLSFQFTIDL